MTYQLLAFIRQHAGALSVFLYFRASRIVSTGRRFL